MTRPASFDTSIMALTSKLRANAIKLTRNRDRADDLVQDTIEKALRYHASYTEGTNLTGWLFTIMRNTYLMQARKDARLVSDIDGKAALTLIQNPSQEATIGLREALAMLFATTPAENAEALLLTASGESYEDVAAFHGVAVGTIKSRVSRARAVLEGVA